MLPIAPTISNEPQSTLDAFTAKFAEIPAEWLPLIKDQPMPLPMWDTLFLVTDPRHNAIIKRLLREFDSDETDQELASDWLAVADTGFVACEADDRIFLGVNGAGYCFYQAHWTPLFKQVYSS